MSTDFSQRRQAPAHMRAVVPRDLRVLAALEQSLGLRLEHRSLTHGGYVFSNGELPTCLSGFIDLLFNYVDFNMFACICIAIFADEVDTIATATPDADAELLVPRAQVLPVWSVLFRCFSTELWLAIAATYLTTAFAWYISSRSFGSLTDMLAVFVGAGWNGLPFARDFLRRLLLIPVLLGVSVVVLSALQGRLFKLMASPPRGLDLQTLEDVADNNLPLLTQGRVEQDLMDMKTELSARLLKLLVVNSDYYPEHLLMAIAKGEQHVGLVSATLNSRIMEGAYPTAFSHFRRLLLVRDMEAYAVKRGSLLTPLIEKVMAHLNEAGLIRRWHEETLRNVIALYALCEGNASLEAGVLPLEADEETRPFVLWDLAVAFGALAVGVALSAVALAAEAAGGRRRRRRQQLVQQWRA
ncbi:hypothetical protein R5R35_007251 [Gryllus longicercus]|uniref:Ionotropic receptor n=1 Tax=Gryllus longicercus TaxID=2509291 RepID=A0AAN9Z7C5_9ORTH